MNYFILLIKVMCMHVYVCACACVPVYILPVSVHADLHVCTHVCRPEVGIYVLLDHSPPVSKVRGGGLSLEPRSH